MNNNFKIEKVEAICAICIIMANRIILNLPYGIIQNTGTGSPINLIYIGIIGFLFVLLLNKLYEKFPSSDIIDISEFLGGKILKIIVSIIFIVFFFFTLAMTLLDFINLIKIVYFEKSPQIFLLFFFILALLISNIIGIKSIVKTICLIVPFTIFSIVLSFFGVVDEFAFYQLTPFLGDGTRTVFVTGLSNLFAFSIITFFYFFRPLLKNSYDFSKVTIWSFLISWTLLFTTVISLLIIFPTTNNSDNINFLYMLARKISLGNFLQRTDALFIFLWILSIFSYLSIITYLINSIFKKLTHSSNGAMFSYFVSSILIGLCLLPFNTAEMKFMQQTIYKYAVLIVVFGIAFAILVFSNLKFKIQKNWLKRSGGKNEK